MMTSALDSGSLEIYAFKLHQEDRASHIASLLFPPVQHNVGVRSMHVIERSLNTKPDANFPFRTTSSGRIHWVTVAYDHGRSSVEYSYIVHSRIIQSYLSGNDDSESPQVVPWSQWGPANTRLIVEYDEDSGLDLTSSEGGASYVTSLVLSWCLCNLRSSSP